MLRLVCKKPFQVSSVKTNLCFFFFHGNPFLKSITHSSESTPTDPKSSLTVSYLTTSCGLSPESALKASKWVTLKTTKNADLVLDFLRSHGFDQTHIAKAITRQPRLLTLHPERNIKPKMDFLTRYGFSDSQLIKLVSREPTIITRSMDKHIAPTLEFLRGLIGTQSDVIEVVDRLTLLLRSFYQERLVPNISALREHGVPVSQVSKYIIKYPNMFCMTAPTRFCEVVTVIHGIGIHPSQSIFIEAVRAMVCLSKSNWDGKFEVYKSFGWSEDEIVSAFRRFPKCMMFSQKKIKRGMEYFIKDLGWEKSYLSKYPVLLGFSLEKTVIPRCSVLQVLLSEGLIKKDMKWTTALKQSEKRFLERFVIKYKNEAPELTRAYQGMTESKGIADV
ncbi:hypothetical protein QJS04_geneDACA003677 [Acorus gramineus]|uniref:Uncharacterized protein n=1 Tax=Acorus gramineus TaxID=55184 RepID=A0AAV9BMW3_ACOGR|nr:hypothetical protein QJS04_geneDACA003677 [Acorus gramineus]